jgi:hypothetical protein
MSLIVLNDDILRKSVKDHLISEMYNYKDRMGFKNDWQMFTHLEKKSEVSRPTIRRVLLDHKTIATPQTFYNLYSSMYETNKYEDLISRVPQEVAEY